MGRFFLDDGALITVVGEQRRCKMCKEAASILNYLEGGGGRK